MTTGVALATRGLTRRFGDRVAVDDLHLRVEEGDVYGFLGPNGAGKTTAMRCMLGLIRRDAGDVEIFGEKDPVRARAYVGAIIETPAFHTWMSGRQNLEQAAAYAGITGDDVARELDRVLDRVGLKERAADQAGTYSLGMKQRLGIARALLGRPKLMLLDEPTNGLDPRGMREMRELVRTLALHDRITIFISSHLLSEVQAICNRVGIIQEGRLRAEGRVEELLVQGIDTGVVEIGGPDPAAIEAVLLAHQEVEVLGPGKNGRVMVRLKAIAPHEVNALLLGAGVAVGSVVPLERNLEDVFLEVTR
jgi:ABC-2 type transport system ATP-binding protein